MHLDQHSAMTTVEEVTMKHPQFRLKVNLSKFFHDARRFCWIFVDGTKMQQVIHMQQHIGQLFNIAEPFHLLLNDTEYLPPIEDVRIVKENETILVVPGSGINDEILAIVETSNDSVYKQSQTNIKTRVVTQDTSNDTLNSIQPTATSNTTRDMTFYSVMSDTLVDSNGGNTSSKTIDKLIDNCNMMNSILSIANRKRVRKRKSKNRSQVIASPPDTTKENIQKEPNSKKPKIIDSYIIPSGKHIRFEMENEENNIAKQIVSKQEVSKNESCLNKSSSREDLSTLLALGHSSTPMTFTNKKLNNEIKTENVCILNDENKRSKNLNKIMEDTIEKDLYSKESKEIQSFERLHGELEKVPIMTRKPQINDIIAFKTLKIGADYTPQTSNFIFTEVVDFCTQSENYTLQILHGRNEIQVPFGKFSVSEDESESHSDGDAFIINYSQMREPRLIS